MKRALGIWLLVMPLSLSLLGCGEERAAVTEDADQEAIEAYQEELEASQEAMSQDPPEGY